MEFVTHQIEIITNKYVYRHFIIEKLIDFIENNRVIC